MQQRLNVNQAVTAPSGASFPAMVHEFPRAERILRGLRDGLISPGSLSKKARLSEASCAQFFQAKAESPLRDDSARAIVVALGKLVGEFMLPGWDDVRRRSMDVVGDIFPTSKPAAPGRAESLYDLMSLGSLLDSWRRQWNDRLCVIALVDLPGGGPSQQHMLRATYLRLACVDLAARIGSSLWLTLGSEAAHRELDHLIKGSEGPFWVSATGTCNYVGERILAALKASDARFSGECPAGKNWAGLLRRRWQGSRRQDSMMKPPAWNTLYEVAAGNTVPKWKTLEWICSVATENETEAAGLRAQLLWAYLARSVYMEIENALPGVAHAELSQANLELIRCARVTLEWIERLSPGKQAIGIACVLLATGTLSTDNEVAGRLLPALAQEAPDTVWLSVFEAAKDDWVSYLRELAARGASFDGKGATGDPAQPALPQNAKVLYGSCAMASMFLRDPRLALVTLLASRDIMPREGSALLQVQVLRALGQDDECLQLLERAVLEHPNSSSLRVNLALLLLDRNEVSRARLLLEKCAADSVEPVHEVVEALAMIYVKSGEWSRLRDLVERAPGPCKSTPARLLVASNLLRQGDISAAHAILNQIQTDLGMHVGAAEFALGVIEHLAGNPRGRDKHLRRARALGWHKHSERDRIE